MKEERKLISLDDDALDGHQEIASLFFTCGSSVSFSGLSETSQCTEYFDRQ